MLLSFHVQMIFQSKFSLSHNWLKKVYNPCSESSFAMWPPVFYSLVGMWRWISMRFHSPANKHCKEASIPFSVPQYVWNGIGRSLFSTAWRKKFAGILVTNMVSTRRIHPHVTRRFMACHSRQNSTLNSVLHTFHFVTQIVYCVQIVKIKFYFVLQILFCFELCLWASDDRV